MRKDMLICRCLDVFSRKQGMTTLLIIRRFLDDCCRNRGMTFTLLSYLGNFSFLSYSCLTRVSMDPRNKSEDDCYKKNESEDDCSECMSEDDKRECALEGEPRECVSKNDFVLRSLFRGDNRGQAIFELADNNVNRKIPGIFLQGRKIGMTMMMWILVSNTSMTNIAHAECTPTPDCASIGYTETSCETTSLKCPFDTSKLYCLPCDSSFKYDCNASNQIGVGNTCNGKYTACTCASGYEWDTSTNTCKATSSVGSCTVGMIYYSDKSCSSSYNSSKTAIGVVIKDNALVMSKDRVSMYWSNAYTDTSLTNYSSSTDAKTDFNGKSNTAVIVAAHPSETTSNNAAIYCNSYTTAGTSAGDWYLPAAGELYSYVYGNYSTLEPVFVDSLGWSDFYWYFWSSSEKSYSNAWFVYSGSGGVNRDDKDFTSSVSCLLDISLL